MNHNSEVLAIVDEDFFYGIENGYYPQLAQDINDGRIEIISIEQYNNLRKCSQISILTNPKNQGKDFYIRNPYTNGYVSVLDDNIVYEFIKDRSLVMKEALVRLGAKEIKLEDNISDKDNLTITGEGKVNNGIGNGHMEYAYKRAQSLNLHSLIESVDPNRKPKSYSVVQDYIFSHGIDNDSGIMLYLERLKEDGRLFGKEKYEITFCSEIQSAFKILSSIDYKLFNAELDFSIEHNCVHTVTKKLYLDFG